MKKKRDAYVNQEEEESRKRKDRTDLFAFLVPKSKTQMLLLGVLLFAIDTARYVALAVNGGDDSNAGVPSASFAST